MTSNQLRQYLATQPSTTPNTTLVQAAIDFTVAGIRAKHFESSSTEQHPSANAVATYKALGNDWYRNKQFDQAIEAYTDAICAGMQRLEQPEQQQDSLGALLYANRAAALFEQANQYKKLSQYEHLDYVALAQHAIQDCKRAIQQGYAIESQYKIHHRSARCHMMLSDHTAAEHDLNMALQHAMMHGASTDSLRGIEKDLQQLHRSSNACLASSVHCNDATQTQATARRDAQQGELESRVTRTYAPNKGNHYVATSTIERADVILLEQPCGLVVTARNTCHQCLKHTIVLIPYVYRSHTSMRTMRWKLIACVYNEQL
jgi:hypothetical protein